MKAILLAGMAAILMVAANSAYADEDNFAMSVQDAIDNITELRNNYLIEKYFGESYHSQRTAAVETVNSAIACTSRLGQGPMYPSQNGAPSPTTPSIPTVRRWWPLT